MIFEPPPPSPIPKVSYDDDGFPRVPQPHVSAWAVDLTREVYTQLKDVATPRGFTMLDCIRPGLDNPHTAGNDGVRVPEGDCYPMFGPYLDQVVAHMHGLEELPPADAGEGEGDAPAPAPAPGSSLPQLPSRLAPLVDSFAVDIARNIEVRAAFAGAPVVCFQPLWRFFTVSFFPPTCVGIRP